VIAGRVATSNSTRTVRRSTNPAKSSHFNAVAGMFRRRADNPSSSTFAREFEMQPNPSPPPDDSEPIFAEGHFTLGNRLFLNKRRDEAAARYRLAIALHPGFAEAFCNLGRASRDAGADEAAIVACERAARLRPDLPEARRTLGATLLSIGRAEEAAAVFRRLLSENPLDDEALCNLATAMTTLGRPDEAARLYRSTLIRAPDHALSWFNLGTVLQGERRLEEAAPRYRRAARLKPDFMLPVYNLGVVSYELGRFDDAIDAYNELLARDPDFAEAHYNLGVIHQDRGRLDEAERAYREATHRRPDHLDALTNLGIIQYKQNRLEAAAAIHGDVLRKNPEFGKARVNLGAALLGLGKLDAAERVLDDADTANRMPEARWNLSLLQLARGDFTVGWEGYESRWATGSRSRDNRLVDRPAWTGEDGGGRVMLLHAEQGFGDTIQFCRYAPLVAARNWRVTLEAQPGLIELLAPALAEAGVDARARDETIPPHDAHCPLLSLPRAFRTTLDAIPADVPYLRVDGERVERARARLTGDPGSLKVGLVWSGNPSHSNDHNRSIRLERLRPLTEVSGVRLFSLQREPRPEDVEALRDPGLGIADLGPELGDFRDTAAFLSALDLLITVDTSVAHLSGALARPTWIALPLIPDWRWLLEREDSPWYPTARLFRQTARGDWDTVIGRIAIELARFRDDRRSFPL